MAYCGPRGLALSEFLSWSLTDQDAALAWQEREKLKCPGCGVYRDEWDADLGGSGEPHPYAVDFDLCRPCAAVERGRQSPEMRSGIHGLRMRLRRAVSSGR